MEMSTNEENYLLQQYCPQLSQYNFVYYSHLPNERFQQLFENLQEFSKL